MSPDASLGTFHERTGRLFEAMMGISTGLELRTTLHRIVVAATETVDASYGALAVLDATGTGMGEFIHVGMSPDWVAGIGHTPRISFSMAQLTLWLPKTLLIMWSPYCEKV